MTVAKKRRTHCDRGHSLKGANLYSWNGRRYCRACRSMQRSVDMQIPIAPFRAWLLRYAVRNNETVRTASSRPVAIPRLAESAGVKPDTLTSIMKPSRRSKEFVQRHLVDTVLTAHGGYHLYDLYPELRDDD